MLSGGGGVGKTVWLSLTMFNIVFQEGLFWWCANAGILWFRHSNISDKHKCAININLWNLSHWSFYFDTGWVHFQMSFCSFCQLDTIWWHFSKTENQSKPKAHSHLIEMRLFWYRNVSSSNQWLELFGIIYFQQAKFIRESHHFGFASNFRFAFYVTLTFCFYTQTNLSHSMSQ